MYLLLNYWLVLWFIIGSISFSELKQHNNVVFIIIDDLRPALECYGDQRAHTPNINKMAENSFLFTRAYAQVCFYLFLY